MSAPRSASLVFRIPREKRDAVHALSARTRVPYAVYMREAVEDLLAKYDGQLRREPDHAREP